MNLRNRLKAVARAHPEHASQLLPLLKVAARVPCCRRASTETERPLRKAIIRVAKANPELRPLLIPLVSTTA